MSWKACIISGIVTGAFVFASGIIWGANGVLTYMIFGAVGGFLGAKIGQFYDSWKDKNA